MLLSSVLRCLRSECWWLGGEMERGFWRVVLGWGGVQRDCGVTCPALGNRGLVTAGWAEGAVAAGMAGLVSRVCPAVGGP